MPTKAWRAPRTTVRSPERWLISGLILQTVGVVGVAVYAWLKLRHQGIGGHITATTVRLAWHADLHTGTGLAVLAVGIVIYAVGSILMARPFLSRPVMLFVTVPLAAVAGMLALGVLVLVVAILAAALAYDFELPLDFDFGGRPRGGNRSGKSRRRA